ncbi:MAG: hypothetical protein ACJ74O_16225 [Frankiaceae bacterium]
MPPALRNPPVPRLRHRSPRGPGTPDGTGRTGRAFGARPAASPGWAARDAATWIAAVAVGAALSAAAVLTRAPLGTAAAPFSGRYRLVLDSGSMLAPALAAVVIAAVVARVHERLGWRALLAAGFAVAAGWTYALALVDGGSGIAAPLAGPTGYLSDVATIGSHPGAFLRDYVASAPSHALATRQHPPGPSLLLWGLRAAGASRPGLLGLVVVLAGALTVPLVAIAVRSLCQETAARRLVPVLALAPYALWAGVSMEAVTATLAAAGIACGAVGSERGRSPWWAVAAGVLLGTACLFSYAAPWLAVSVIAVYFVRRRPLLNVLSGAGALLPLLVALLAGFSWEAGLRAASGDFALRVEPHRSWAVWVLLDLAVLAVAAGPALVTSLRKARRTPGWPFLVGAGLAVALATATGLARGEVERSWLPFFPWLLVAAVAPELRARSSGGDGGTDGSPDGDPAGEAQSQAAQAAPVPVGLVALGALTAVALAAVLRSPW